MDIVRTSQEAHHVSAKEHNQLMRSIYLWLWCINITITILDIIHRLGVYLKHDVSETGFYLCFQEISTQLGTVDRVSLLLLYRDRLALLLSQTE
jgi:hypothetical protein